VIGAQGLTYGDNNDRYQAVNLNKADTIEVRIFRSNVSQIGFLKNLEFCDALAAFCRIASNVQLRPDHFLAFIDRNRGAYPNFTRWAVREGLMTTRHVIKPGDEEALLIA